MHSLINKIQSKIKSNIFIDYDMKKSTWFRAGGNASGYVIVNSISDLKKIISYSDQIKYYIVRVGSNLMVRDGGFNGLIIKLGKNFYKIMCDFTYGSSPHKYYNVVFFSFIIN